MNNFENYVYEPIDLCACYEPMIEAPQELLDEWQTCYDTEPEGVPTFYVTDEYGTLIENVIRYAAAHQTEKAAEN